MELVLLEQLNVTFRVELVRIEYVVDAETQIPAGGVDVVAVLLLGRQRRRALTALPPLSQVYSSLTGHTRNKTGHRFNVISIVFTVRTFYNRNLSKLFISGLKKIRVFLNN